MENYLEIQEESNLDNVYFDDKYVQKNTCIRKRREPIYESSIDCLNKPSIYKFMKSFDG